MIYLVTVTFSWCFKVHFGFLSLKCKRWIISVVFVVVYFVTVTFSRCFKFHFGFLSLKCKSWNISLVFCCGLPCHCYILLMFQSSCCFFSSWNIYIDFSNHETANKRTKNILFYLIKKNNDQHSHSILFLISKISM